MWVKRAKFERKNGLQEKSKEILVIEVECVKRKKMIKKKKIKSRRSLWN